MLANLVELTDVRMADACGRARFAPQSFACLVACQLGAHRFQRNGAPQAWIVGGIHDAHSTFANLSQNSVRTDLLSHQLVCSGSARFRFSVPVSPKLATEHGAS